MTYQCIWRCRTGSVLCILRPSSCADGANTKLLILALEDLKESVLGNVVFRRLYSTAMSPASHEIRTTARNTLPTYLALPPPPAEPLPCPALNNVPSAEKSARGNSILPVSPTVESAQARSAQRLFIQTRIVSVLISLSMQLLALWMKIATFLLPRFQERLQFGEPPVPLGMKRVRWRCVCIPVY